MLVRASTIILVLTVALSLTPAFAASHVLDVPGPSLVVLETKAGAELGLEDGTLDFVVLEASPSHLVLAAAGPGILIVDGPEDAELYAIRASSSPSSSRRISLLLQIHPSLRRLAMALGWRPPWGQYGLGGIS